MAVEKLFDSETNLIKSDEFYLFYEMMVQSLKTDNVREGLDKSLMLLRNFLGSSNVALYLANQEGSYLIKESDSPMGELSAPISCIINKIHSLFEKKELLDLDLNFSEKLKNLILLNIKLEKGDCVIAIVNNKLKNLKPIFWDRLCETMQIILKRAASYEKNTRAISMDILTGLDNRNSYEKRIKSINEADENIIYGIFDLFRLKYVNDTFSHDKGDIYIKEAAKILNKYWPKYRKVTDENCIEKMISTGSCIYRIGGDEFALISSSENISVSNIKANLAFTESELISLGVKEDLPVGLNYGIAHHKPGDNIKQTIEQADALLQQEKKKMYVKYNIVRRH